jgi:ubiquinone/menaquinone biosynthesis C-methylase UbiE
MNKTPLRTDGQSAVKPAHSKESRSPDQIRQHYLIEKELASRLRAARREERKQLYTQLYDELFQRVPDHPQLILKRDDHTRRRHVAERVALLEKLLPPNATYLELGPGDCSLALEIAKRVQKVYAIDVSHEIAAGVAPPGNLELIISDGSSVPVPDNSVDVAYSDQLMEHLHPDDAVEQLQNIYRVLKPGGKYLCITPNRFSGPHDVSQFFDEVATGFHLKEYSLVELAKLFRTVGFSKLETMIGARGFHLNTPTALVTTFESILAKAPRRLRRTLGRRLPFRLALGIKLVGTK